MKTKNKRKLKKILTIILSMLALLLPMTISAYADTVYIPNTVINAPDTYQIVVGTPFSITGYATGGTHPDAKASTLTVAGRVSGFTKAVVTSIASPVGSNRYLVVNTKTPSGTDLGSLSYSGTGSSDSTASYIVKKATCIYYILVDAETRSVGSARTYLGTPSITSQI